MAAGFMNDRQGTRVIQGLTPGFYDKAVRSDPSATEEDWTYIVTNADGSTQVVGIVRTTYTSGARTAIAQIERIG